MQSVTHNELFLKSMNTSDYAICKENYIPAVMNMPGTNTCWGLDTSLNSLSCCAMINQEFLGAQAPNCNLKLDKNKSSYQCCYILGHYFPCPKFDGSLVYHSGVGCMNEKWPITFSHYCNYLSMPWTTNNKVDLGNWNWPLVKTVLQHLLTQYWTSRNHNLIWISSVT